jgi:hypothetical protein
MNQRTLAVIVMFLIFLAGWIGGYATGWIGGYSTGADAQNFLNKYIESIRSK